MPKRVDALIERVCGPEDPLAAFLRRWSLDSRAFLAFVEANESKLRRKIRQAGDEPARLDLLAEWAAAPFFLADRRFAVQYEPLRAGGGRSADFGVTFRTHTPFQVEVTRLRAGGSPPDLKLARTLADKAGQLAPGRPNLLLVVTAPDIQAGELLGRALQQLNAMPELGREFQRARPRLSNVLLASLDENADLHARHLWLNTQAKHALPAEVVRFLQP